LGNSLDRLCHTISVAYLVELVLLNKHQISGGAYLDCYRKLSYVNCSVHELTGRELLCLHKNEKHRNVNIKTCEIHRKYYLDDVDILKYVNWCFYNANRIVFMHR